MLCFPMRIRNLSVIFVTAASLLLVSDTGARPKKRKPAGARDGDGFSYYLLTLSYAPDFCAQAAGNKDPRECGAGRRVGFVVHGLWPQGETGRGPERCGPARPVSQDIVRDTLNYVPSESLIQHEWADHGTCSGLDAAEYFALLRKGRDSVRIPDDLKAPAQLLHLGASDIETKLARANPGFPAGAFRVTCYRDGELQEIRICLNKDLSPRSCGSSAGGCSAGDVSLNPVR